MTQTTLHGKTADSRALEEMEKRLKHKRKLWDKKYETKWNKGVK